MLKQFNSYAVLNTKMFALKHETLNSQFSLHLKLYTGTTASLLRVVNFHFTAWLWLSCVAA